MNFIIIEGDMRELKMTIEDLRDKTDNLGYFEVNTLL